MRPVRVLCTGPRARPLTQLATTSKTVVEASLLFRAVAVRSDRRTRSAPLTIHSRREAEADQNQPGEAVARATANLRQGRRNAVALAHSLAHRSQIPL